ncbi:MAG TPA: 16S rRNA (uracil(1498)-N(3))-methyltransferase [Firmicutes bacterium]|nr:16S rRNA (uracil(1498)-N(3))-methyltransferase [Candidatus Fermentithermobacillaceae bacterium]
MQSDERRSAGNQPRSLAGSENALGDQRRASPSETSVDAAHTPPQFFVTSEMVLGGQIVLTEDLFRHAMAKRLRPGEVFRAVLGQTGYEAKVISVKGDSLLADIVGRQTLSAPPVAVHLYAALLKGQKFDLVVEKATELGVASIHPVITSRTIPRLESEKAASRKERWDKIAKAAAQQCGRPFVPEIAGVTSLDEALRGAVRGRRLLAHEHEVKGASLPELLQGQSEVSVLIGPEGGLDSSEVESAMAAGFSPMSLGPYILKAETASIAAVAILMRFLLL